MSGGSHIRTPRQLEARTPASVQEVRERARRAQFGSCGGCSSALDNDHWLVGSTDVGITKCCTEACAWSFHDAHQDEWDLHLYGRCQVESCLRVIRSPGAWTVETIGGEYVTCSRACALQLLRLTASRNGLDLDPRDFAAFRASVAGDSSSWPDHWTVNWVPGRGYRDTR